MRGPLPTPPRAVSPVASSWLLLLASWGGAVLSLRQSVSSISVRLCASSLSCPGCSGLLSCLSLLPALSSLLLQAAAFSVARVVPLSLFVSLSLLASVSFRSRTCSVSFAFLCAVCHHCLSLSRFCHSLSSYLALLSLLA